MPYVGNVAELNRRLRLRSAISNLLLCQDGALDGDDPAPVLALVADVQHAVWCEWLRRKMERQEGSDHA
jgi:hypothetical protein